MGISSATHYLLILLQELQVPLEIVVGVSLDSVVLRQGEQLFGVYQASVVVLVIILVLLVCEKAPSEHLRVFSQSQSQACSSRGEL